MWFYLEKRCGRIKAFAVLKIMAQYTLYHNPRCSKSREALGLLQSKGVDVQVIEYLKESPSAEDLKQLISKLKSPASALVRTKEDLYQDLKFDLNSTEHIVENLVKYPQLIERPIVVKDDRAIVARPVNLIETLF